MTNYFSIKKECFWKIYDLLLITSGVVAPVFFGSAVINFGIQELLVTFCEISPSPRSRVSDKRMVEPTDANYS